jgi:uncharacterized protein (DUF2236 family)
MQRAVVGESILLAGGGRALLLQLAHPAVARGVAEHSRFATDPTDRLVGTVGYLYTLAFGTEEEIRQVARRVGGAHRGVRSDDQPHAYDARDVDLQLWVAATLYDTTVVMYELAWGRLPDEIDELVFRESARIGTALGMPADVWPESRDAFARYWREQIETLEVGPEARQLARDLLRPDRPQPRLRPILPLARIVTAGLLPERIRAGYGVDWTPRLEAQYRGRLGLLLGIYRILPRTVRTLPSRLWPR